MQKASIGRYDATNNPGATGPYDIVYMKIDTASIHNGSFTSINDVNKNDLFNVNQNYPNPFTAITNVPVNFKRSTDVTVRIMDLTGKEVFVNNYNNVSAGASTLEINASGLSSGLYLYSIEAEGFKVSRRMIVE
jgi:hypothetical protein